MKNKLIAASLLMLTGTIISCDDDTNDLNVGTLENPAEVGRVVEVRNILTSIFDFRTDLVNSPNGRGEGSESELDSLSGGRIDHRGRTSGDWDTCAGVTETTDGNGSLSVTFDYGSEGCDEYGVLMSGKVTKTYGADFVEATFVSYSANGITLDGTSRIDASWFQDPDKMDSLDYTSVRTNSLIITYESTGEVLTVDSEFTEDGSDIGLQMTGFITCESSMGDSFRSDITSPLVYSFSCENVWSIAVQGVETCVYNETSYSIDYGDGTCDTTAEVTVNGNTEIVDLTEDELGCGSCG